LREATCSTFKTWLPRWMRLEGLPRLPGIEIGGWTPGWKKDKDWQGMVKTFRGMLIFAALLVLLGFAAPATLHAQSLIDWSSFENISKTATASTFPAIAADRFGQVHVIWSEDVDGNTSNLRYNASGAPLLDRRGKQVNYLTNRGNTLYYKRWNGEKWSNGVDIITSLDSLLSFPELAADSKGVIHLIYTKSQNEITDLMYAQAPGDQAEAIGAWSEPVILASGLIAYDHPVSLTVDPADGLHLLYFKMGASPGVFVINSFDGGKTWSDAVLLFSTASVTGDEDGAQPVRIVADAKGRLHAMWTHYGADGNGKAIYYSQSFDQGLTWSNPTQIAAWQPGWYEVDWLNAGLVGDEIHLVWEGGPIAYNNERISVNGGQSWGPARRIMPSLVGENGFADLVVDSAGTLHQLIVKRIGAGTQIVYGLWHSEYHDSQWTMPVMVGLQDENLYDEISDLSGEAINSLLAGTIMDDGLRYQRSVILNGNELFVVVVNEYDGEIYATRGALSVPRISPAPLPTAAPLATRVATSGGVQTIAPTPTASFEKNRGGASLNPGTLVTASLIPVILIILGLVIYSRIHHK